MQLHLSGQPLRVLSRVGYATKGCVYIVMGVLAALTATGLHLGQIGDKQRSVQSLSILPGGRVLLGIVAIGLTGYALLRIVQGLLDTEDKGHDPKGILQRFGYVVNGIIYTGLIWSAGYGAWSGKDAKSASAGERSLTERVLHWPGGASLIMFIGAVIVGAGGYMFYQSYTSKFLKAIELETLGRNRRRFVQRAGQIGYAARGTVMLIVGSFFLHAGHTARSSAIGDAADALRLLARMNPIALGAVSLGLVAYGVYALLQAAYPLHHD